MTWQHIHLFIQRITSIWSNYLVEMPLSDVLCVTGNPFAHLRSYMIVNLCSAVP